MLFPRRAYMTSKAVEQRAMVLRAGAGIQHILKVCTRYRYLSLNMRLEIILVYLYLIEFKSINVNYNVIHHRTVHIIGRSC